jgi:hypothetical protein
MAAATQSTEQDPDVAQAICCGCKGCHCARCRRDRAYLERLAAKAERIASKVRSRNHVATRMTRTA